jgi:hypothetical protein
MHDGLIVRIWGAGERLPESDKVYDKWGPKIGQEYFDQVRKILQEYPLYTIYDYFLRLGVLWWRAWPDLRLANRRRTIPFQIEKLTADPPFFTGEVCEVITENPIVSDLSPLREDCSIRLMVRC